LWKCHHNDYRWGSGKFRLDYYGIWVKRDLYRTTPGVTRDFVFCDLIQKIILLVWFASSKGVLRTYFDPGHHGIQISNNLRRSENSLYNSRTERLLIRVLLGCANLPNLIVYLLFYIPLKHFSLILRCHHCRWRTAKFMLMLSNQGHWAGRDLYHATPAVTWDLGFSGLIRRTDHSVASYDTQKDAENLF
jgi:hypothetical protein